MYIYTFVTNNYIYAGFMFSLPIKMFWCFEFITEGRDAEPNWGRQLWFQIFKYNVLLTEFFLTHTICPASVFSMKYTEKLLIAGTNQHTQSVKFPARERKVLWLIVKAKRPTRKLLKHLNLLQLVSRHV